MRVPWTVPARRWMPCGSGTPAAAALLALVKGADGLDLIGAQLELEGREVRDDPLGGDGLGDHHVAQRQVPGDHDLGRSGAMGLCDPRDHRLDRKSTRLNSSHVASSY